MSTLLLMSPSEDSDQEEVNWWEVLADSPFGDMAFFAAICLVGGGARYSFVPERSRVVAGCMSARR
jgi:hypothetical protein